jgi:hypothetical protein
LIFVSTFENRMSGRGNDRRGRIVVTVDAIKALIAASEVRL